VSALGKQAIGFLECAGYGAALYAMDKACKAADITILGMDSINPKDTSANIPMTMQVKFQGSVSDVEIAVKTAGEAALEFNKPSEIITAIIDNPYSGVDKLCAISKVKFKK
jgi:microcompartment protein CcmL/EutN